MNKERFYSYVMSFYGPDEIYDMNCTLDMVMEATEKYLSLPDTRFDGDSFDRENVRDIMMNDYGLKFLNVKIKRAHY
jgi:hypothetical protein